MKNYKNSDYAANKYSDGIVYRFNNQTITITLEKYLAENPDKTEADFLELKALSDEIYHEQVQLEHATNRRNIPLSLIDETECCAIRPIDEYIDKQEDNEAIKTIFQFLDRDILTKTQKQRFVKFFIQGLSERQIAARENTSNVAISKSINQCLKKLKKYFDEMG